MDITVASPSSCPRHSIAFYGLVFSFHETFVNPVEIIGSIWLTQIFTKRSPSIYPSIKAVCFSFSSLNVYVIITMQLMAAFYLFILP